MHTRLLTLVTALALLVGIGAMAFAFAPRADVTAQSATDTFYREAPLDAANVITIDETSAASTGWAPADLASFYITCTEDSGTATLDVTVQRSTDGGTTWTTVVAFTQLAATGAELKTYADVRASTAQIIGNRIRLNYDTTGSGQYTCSAHMVGEG